MINVSENIIFLKNEDNKYIYKLQNNFTDFYLGVNFKSNIKNTLNIKFKIKPKKYNSYFYLTEPGTTKIKEIVSNDDLNFITFFDKIPQYEELLIEIINDEKNILELLLYTMR